MPPETQFLRLPETKRRIPRFKVSASRLTFSLLLLVARVVPVCAQDLPRQLGTTDSDTTYREVFLMGTIATVQVRGGDKKSRLQLAGQLIASLEQTESELSTWRDSSELSRLNTSKLGKPFSLSKRTCDLLGEVFELSRRTDGAFDPAIGGLLSVWDLRGQGRLPVEEQLHEALRATGIRHLDLNGTDCELRRKIDTTIDAGAFGKGAALDRLKEILPEFQGLSWQVNLGGQVFVSVAPGQSAWKVGLASPIDRQSVVADLTLEQGSLATSGSLLRDKWVEEKRIGHILDPRTGQPAEFLGSVVVWHEQALDADVFSTALFVMGPVEGLLWAEKGKIAACYLFMENDQLRIIGSSEFQKRFFERAAWLREIKITEPD